MQGRNFDKPLHKLCHASQRLFCKLSKPKSGGDSHSTSGSGLSIPLPLHRAGLLSGQNYPKWKAGKLQGNLHTLARLANIKLKE